MYFAFDYNTDEYVDYYEVDNQCWLIEQYPFPEFQCGNFAVKNVKCEQTFLISDKVKIILEEYNLENTTFEIFDLLYYNDFDNQRCKVEDNLFILRVNQLEGFENSIKFPLLIHLKEGSRILEEIWCNNLVELQRLIEESKSKLCFTSLKITDEFKRKKIDLFLYADVYDSRHGRTVYMSERLRNVFLNENITGFDFTNIFYSIDFP